MRFLIPLILMCTLAGYTQAQDRLTELPSGTAELQIRGSTYYQHGDNYYRFHPQGGYYYEVRPPYGVNDTREAHQYRRDMSGQRGVHPGINVEEGCRNQAADVANRNPTNGGRLYIREFNRCMNTARQN